MLSPFIHPTVLYCTCAEGEREGSCVNNQSALRPVHRLCLVKSALRSVHRLCLVKSALRSVHRLCLVSVIEVIYLTFDRKIVFSAIGNFY